jgi:hypothetical protein
MVPRIGYNPQDRFVVVLGDTLVVSTQVGDVFGAEIVAGPIVNRNFLQTVSQFSGAKIDFKSKMNAIHRLFSFLLCATTAILWLFANAYAQSKDTKTCAILAGTLFPNISMQINTADQAHQMIQRKVYAACLQARGKQRASRMTAPGQPGTNTTNAGTFVTFDVPGATITGPRAINNSRATTGGYLDAGGFHSFLRSSDGTITPFDPPGATCQFECSTAVGITPEGTIVGSFFTVSTEHGYLRAPSGTVTVFDAPGSQSTSPSAINPAGTVTGEFSSSTVASHGFLRAPNGTFTTFDPLGSTLTLSVAINPAGTVTGSFFDVRFGEHGFLRTSDGTITAFDPSADSTIVSVSAINPTGTIVGEFFTTAGFEHGFLRAPNGIITVFDPPGSTLTQSAGINPAGTIVGSFITADFSASHGYLRAPNGTITVFDPPGSEFTSPTAIDPAGTVTGIFVPPDFFPSHGFVGRPKNMR